jgi:hypothetical protein
VVLDATAVGPYETKGTFEGWMSTPEQNCIVFGVGPLGRTAIRLLF